MKFADHDIVCLHLQLTKADLVKAIREKHITTFEQLQDETDVSTVCGSCAADVELILEEELEKRRSNNG